MKTTMKLTMKTRDIASKVLKHNGREKQLRKLQEECGELIAAVGHYLDIREESYQELVGEIADVFFLLMQMRIDIGPGIIDQMIDYKATRTLNRIRKETGMLLETEGIENDAV